MRNSKPIDISMTEWREIMQLPAVREGWGLTDETPEEFSSRVYAVKCDFVSGSPGYVGELYIVQGDALGAGPLLLIRQDSLTQPRSRAISTCEKPAALR
jgi:hypothetical protein